MKINYSNLTFSQLVTKIGNSRFWDLPAMLEEVLNKLSGRVETLENAPTPSGGIETLSGDFVDNADPLNPVLDRGYKVYTAIMNQGGINPPNATVLENTLGEIPTFGYDDVGQFTINSALSLFNSEKTVVEFSMPNDPTGSLSYDIPSDSYIPLFSSDTNGIMVYAKLEIKVYN